MADYRALARHHPAVRAYIRHRRWTDRAGVTAYAPGTDGGAFSIDDFGFRRGMLAGASFDLSAAFGGHPYGLVLGSSHVFGFGLATDADTIPSHLSARTGFPCLNLSFPEAQLQALHAVALRICRQAPRPPALIAVLPGGMLTRYAYVRACDPLFGVPDFTRGAMPGASPGSPAETAAFGALMAYTTFWLQEIASLAASQGCPCLIHPESTAFEKPALSQVEQACALGVPQSQADILRFATHRLRYAAYTQGLIACAPRGAVLRHCDPAALHFLDEFHYTHAATAIIADRLSDQWLPRS